jgi:hypothetical protein
MLRKLFLYLFGPSLNAHLESFREDLRAESRLDLDASIGKVEVALGRVFADCAVEQDAALRRDMALEMRKVGLAMIATNRQVVLSKQDILILKDTHDKILELARKLAETPIVPEKRPPGQVDWVPSPAHFGNKIELLGNEV